MAPREDETMTTIKTGTLMAYDTAETIREATEAETLASIEAAKRDGGAGVIEVDGRSCYVEGGEVVEG
jgi:predicted  nucleic acid-binding Zn-ribbon protein